MLNSNVVCLLVITSSLINQSYSISFRLPSKEAWQGKEAFAKSTGRNPIAPPLIKHHVINHAATTPLGYLHVLYASCNIWSLHNDWRYTFDKERKNTAKTPVDPTPLGTLFRTIEWWLIYNLLLAPLVCGISRNIYKWIGSFQLSAVRLGLAYLVWLLIFMSRVKSQSSRV